MLIVTNHIRGLMSDVRQLLLPTGCVTCGRAGGWLCAGCRRPVPEWPAIVRVDDVAVAAGADYDRLGAAVLEWKQHGVAALEGVLIETLLAAIDVVWDSDAVIVPVPTTSAARRRRGRDAVGRLAQAVALSRGAPVVPALAWTGRRREQKGLSAEQRRINMRGSLTAHPMPELAAAPVIVVDDVLTTGATVSAAVHALRTAGVCVHAGAVVCATHGHIGESWPPDAAVPVPTH